MLLFSLSLTCHCPNFLKLLRMFRGQEVPHKQRNEALIRHAKGRAKPFNADCQCRNFLRVQEYMARIGTLYQDYCSTNSLAALTELQQLISMRVCCSLRQIMAFSS